VLPAAQRPRPGARANLFGMTESAGPYCGAQLDRDLPASKHGSCGRPFAGIEVRIYCLVHRQQGLMVVRGNPKEIAGLGDLTRPDVSYVNRQRGAGTRVLLDYSLDLLGIDTGQIQGYNHEQYTHLAVASVISSGRADCWWR
jgi:putative molybdopterin biosynthesis protein